MQDPACTFCQIEQETLSGFVVLEGEMTLGFLDIHPLFPRHTLLIPRQHYETLPDLPAELLAPMMADAQLLARAMVEGLGAEGSFVAINNRVSQSVPHLHIHVVPRTQKDGVRGFFWPRTPYEDEAHTLATQERLSAAVAALRSGADA
jgi:histidine triad (HIT) family protein